MNKSKKIIIGLIAVFNIFVFLFSILFTIIAFTNMPNWAMFLLWYFTLPLHISTIVSFTIFILQLILIRDKTKRKEILIKHISIVAIIYFAIIIILTLIFISNGIV